MKKILKVLIGVLVVVTILGIIIYSKTKVISDDNKITINANNNNKVERIVKIDGKLYYDTGKESNIDARCGVMDGKIISNVSNGEIPTEDGQSNFEGQYDYQYGTNDTIEIKIDNKWYVFQEKAEAVSTSLTLDDEIKNDTIWCGTFQLIWNDLKNELAKQDIIFNPQLKVVENLNKETFKTTDISDKYYYKKYGVPSIALKNEIEKAIKDKFNETSDILDDFNWKDENGYFLYAMLKKEFKFETAFEELDNGTFGIYDNVKYFGIKTNDSEELRAQVKVLYYNSKDDFAIELNTKQEDEVILCKNPEGNTFNDIYKNIKDQEDRYEGNRKLMEAEYLKIPNIKIDEKKEFEEIENNEFEFSDGSVYSIEKAIQTIKFELDKNGGKIKSEAGMMLKETMMLEPEEKREFFVDDTFAIFLKENGKDTPYFAGKISDIRKFQ